MKQSQWGWTHTPSCPAVKAKATNSATVCPSVCLCLCVPRLLWPRKYCFYSHQLHLPAVMPLLSFLSSLCVIYILFSPFYSFSLREAECREHKLLAAGEAGWGYWGFTFTVCTHPSSAVSALHTLSSSHLSSQPYAFHTCLCFNKICLLLFTCFCLFFHCKDVIVFLVLQTAV